MEDSKIDLTVQAHPQLRVLPVTLGVLHIIGGILFISGGNAYFGFLNLALGPMWLLWGLFYSRINRHMIVIHEGAPGNLQRSLQDPQNTLGIDFGNPFRVDQDGNPG